MTEAPIKNLSYSEQQIGSKIKSSKIHFIWEFDLDNNREKIELFDSRWSGKKKVLINNHPEFETIETGSFTKTFDIHGHVATIIQYGDKSELRFDNQSFSHLYNLEKNKNAYVKGLGPTSQVYSNAPSNYNSSKIVNNFNLENVMYKNEENKSDNNVKNKLFSFSIKKGEHDKKDGLSGGKFTFGAKLEGDNENFKIHSQGVSYGKHSGKEEKGNVDLLGFGDNNNNDNNNNNNNNVKNDLFDVFGGNNNNNNQNNNNNLFDLGNNNNNNNTNNDNNLFDLGNNNNNNNIQNSNNLFDLGNNNNNNNNNNNIQNSNNDTNLFDLGNIHMNSNNNNNNNNNSNNVNTTSTSNNNLGGFDFFNNNINNTTSTNINDNAFNMAGLDFNLTGKSNTNQQQTNSNNIGLDFNMLGNMIQNSSTNNNNFNNNNVNNNEINFDFSLPKNNENNNKNENNNNNNNLMNLF